MERSSAEIKLIMNLKPEDLFYGATFDDFLFRPQLGKVKTRKEVDLTMPLTRRINIRTPLVGANMDTVTREKMMKALSLEGCFGFLDRNCSITAQVERVKYVKRQHSFIIENPTRLSKEDTIGQARQIVESQNVSSLLIEAYPGSNILAGLLSHRDILAAGNQDQRPVSDFMTPFKKLVTASLGIPIAEAERLMLEKRIEKLPLVDQKRSIKGLITIRDLQLNKQKPYSTQDKKGRLLVGATIGVTGDYLERAEALISAGADCVLMDAAHAHSQVFGTAVKNFRRKFKQTELVCGNVGTGEGARFLMNLGANAVKVGIGPGRGCRTRLEVGAGIPQLQAIREAYLATGGKIPIIADGGIKNDKDIALAILCGASTVMLGSMLSGADESPGVVTEDPNTRRKIKIYRGMTSVEAVLDGFNESDSESKLKNTQAQEGQSVVVPYIGNVSDIITRIRDHLRSAVSYSGEASLLSAHKKISANPADYLVRLSEASKKESWDR